MAKLLPEHIEEIHHSIKYELLAANDTEDLLRIARTLDQIILDAEVTHERDKDNTSNNFPDWMRDAITAPKQ